MNRIELEGRSNYGNEAIYVVSSHSSAISQLTGKKTISRADIQALRDLGLMIEHVTSEDIELQKILAEVV